MNMITLQDLKNAFFDIEQASGKKADELSVELNMLDELLITENDQSAGYRAWLINLNDGSVTYSD